MRDRSRRFVHVSAGLLLAAWGMLACAPARRIATRYPRADLDAAYAGAVRNPERNPVLLIPGFAGTDLMMPDGKKVWGALGKGSMSYAKREGIPGFALDIARLPIEVTPGMLAHIDDDVAPGAMLERFDTAFLGADINFPVYSGLVDTVVRGGYVDPGAPEAASDPSAPSWFAFSYDWRQDMAGTAVELSAFIERARAVVAERRARAGLPDREIRFDVVAHSMGGLLARHYLRYGPHDAPTDGAVPWAGAADFDRLVVVATPNFGTMKALRDLIHGRGHAVLPTIAAAQIATWPALYQMLPRADHPLWIDESGAPVVMPPYSARLFRENGWGAFSPREAPTVAALYPDIVDEGERLDRMAAFMDAAFERARRFHAGLDRVAPTRCPIPVLLFTGDADDTLYRARVRTEEGRLVLDFAPIGKLHLGVPGDGTVTRASALADLRMDGRGGWLRSPIEWTASFFVSDRHSSFLGNPAFQDNLLHLLLDVPPPGTGVAP